VSASRLPSEVCGGEIVRSVDRDVPAGRLRVDRGQRADRKDGIELSGGIEHLADGLGCGMLSPSAARSVVAIHATKPDPALGLAFTIAGSRSG
jgi:hypothetical protein